MKKSTNNSMSIALGTIQYQLGEKPVLGYGLSLSTSDLDSALEGSIPEVVFDDKGKADIHSLLMGVAETGFEKSEIERILTREEGVENWRVGEALAEVYLVHHKDCFFPWPDGRDERKTGSSLPGADLVGFQSIDGEDFFVFGEVKTSNENTYPPSLMHGRTGLKQQLEDLRDNDKIKDDLFLYLGYRATTAPWKSRYENAAKKYIQQKNNVRIFGLLVRDVSPHQDDLRARVNKLTQNIPSDMIIELLAIYLPNNTISSLGRRVKNSRNKGSI
ncbi:TPA: hypothetical protein JF897_000377 [Legionella pneumophila]|nr:hypothetical protein [Legionella pneumophila]